MTKKRTLTIVLIIIPVIIIVLLALYFIFTPGTSIEDKEEALCEPVYRYGIQVDSLMQYDDEVKSGENLSVLLQRYKVDHGTINSLVRQSEGIFDVRKIKAGNKYTVICSKDSVNTPLYFIYEDSPATYVVYGLGDSLHVHYGKKDMELRIVFASGVIESSLWNAMASQGINPTLALELSDVYAWAIDFFGVQKGDSFRTYYEQIYVEGEPLNVGRVVSACFNHAGKDFYAFYFVQDEMGDYFDEKGNSLRKAFLKAPLKFSRISSHFSHSRLHPILRIRRPHHGV
ncbi:MAG: metalloendopeptidase, partial [Bacteroidales bacterium]|nr:metalloendopeptidase [Bacteroidales bacterium]